MSLNNIEIPDIVITELYRDNLLGSTVKSPAINRRPATTIQPAVTPRSATATEAIQPARPSDIAEQPIVPTPPPTTTPAAPASPVSTSTIPPAAPPPAASSSPAAIQAPSGPVYKSLGNNRKQITIIVQSPGIAFLPDDQLTVLTRMLEACRMNMGDVAIVNHASEPVVIQSLRQQLNPAIILLFGIQPVDIGLPINFPVFKIQAYDDCTYLYSPSLAELLPPTEESKLLKSKLWVCLKTLFGI